MGSTRQAELAARLRLAVMRLARRLRQQAPEPLSPSQLSVLSTLESHGPLAPTELAAAERVRPPTITRVVGILEEAGLVRRKSDPGDRRSSRVELTARGRELIERDRRRKTAYLAKEISKLSVEEVRALNRAVDLIERMVREQ
jgi:DNA-binding MarR family transcriptional regulator